MVASADATFIAGSENRVVGDSHMPKFPWFRSLFAAPDTCNLPYRMVRISRGGPAPA
jgi:hypothetical protein